MSKQGNISAERIMLKLLLFKPLEKLRQHLELEKEVTKEVLDAQDTFVTSFYATLDEEVNNEYNKNYKLPESKVSEDPEETFKKIHLALYKLITLKVCLWHVEAELKKIEGPRKKINRLRNTIQRNSTKRFRFVYNLFPNIQLAWNQWYNRAKLRQEPRVKILKTKLEAEEHKIKLDIDPKICVDLPFQGGLLNNREVAPYTILNKIENQMSKEGKAPSCEIIQCYKKLSEAWVSFSTLKENQTDEIIQCYEKLSEAWVSFSTLKENQKEKIIRQSLINKESERNARLRSVQSNRQRGPEASNDSKTELAEDEIVIDSNDLRNVDDICLSPKLRAYFLKRAKDSSESKGNVSTVVGILRKSTRPHF